MAAAALGPCSEVSITLRQFPKQVEGRLLPWSEVTKGSGSLAILGSPKRNPFSKE